MDSSPRTDPTDAAGFASPADALRASEARYRALATASANAIYRMSPDWREMRRLDGRGFLADTAEPSDRWLGQYILPDDQARVTAAIEEAIRDKGVFELEHRVVRADGTIGWTLSRAVPMLDHAGEIVEWIGAASDITARKEAEAAVRESEEREREARDRDALRRMLVLAEEEERRRLARELHDEAGQHLTALGLGLQALSNVASPGSEIDRRTTELRALAHTLAVEMHGIAMRLRPRALDDFGLEAALTAYAEEWSRHSGIAVDVHAAVGASRLPMAIESAVYRVVQEALTNVARHSGARHAAVVVEKRDGYLIAVVEDDGRGFEPEAPDEPAKHSGGLGLLGIRERAALLGGTLDVESPPGGGTTLFVRIPITDETQGAAGEDPTSLH